MGRTNETRDGFWQRIDERTGRTGRTWHTSLGGARVSTGCTSLENARAWRVKQEREAVDPSHKAARETTIATAIDRFVTEIETAKRSASTVSFYKQKLGIFLTYFGSAGTLADITPGSLVQFVRWRTSERKLEDGAVTVPADLTTVRKEIESLLTMLRSARHRREFTADVNGLKPLRLDAKYVPREKYPTPEVFAELCTELDRRGLQRRSAWLCAAVATAGRLGEIDRLRVDDIDLPNGRYKIHVTKTKKTEGAVRVRPVLDFAVPLLAYAIKHGAGPKGHLVQPWKPSNLKQTLERVGRALGHTEFYTANDFRRAHASWLNQGGAAPNLIAYMLGHVDARMVERVYGRMTPTAAGRLIGAAIVRTDSVPETSVQAWSQPTKNSGNTVENTRSDDNKSGAERILIPLIGVRIPAPEPLENQGGVVTDPPSETGCVPDSYRSSDFSDNSREIAGLALRPGVAAASASDRRGVAVALAAAALAADEIDPADAERFVGAVIAGGAK